MSAQKVTKDQSVAAPHKPQRIPRALSAVPAPLSRQLGNATIQRLLAQRSAGQPAELDDALAQRINRARGGGEALDNHIQKQIGEGLGADFSQVRVHTGQEADVLNQELQARAFTTGQDIFFRDGQYNPGSTSGRELLAHELTHVVQQASGAVPSSGRMAVNAPGDRFEQEANAVASSIGSAAAPEVQRVEEQEGEEYLAQMQEMPEEEALADD
jgi:hypothetical protein